MEFFAYPNSISNFITIKQILSGGSFCLAYQNEQVVWIEINERISSLFGIFSDNRVSKLTIKMAYNGQLVPKHYFFQKKLNLLLIFAGTNII